MPSFRTSLRRRTVAILATGIASLFASPAVHSEIYYWEPTPSVGVGDNTLNGGAGTWDTTLANFTTSSTDSDLVTHSTWGSANNAGTDTVIFGGATGGIVTINTFSPNVLTGSNVLGVSNLTFRTSGYTLTGNNQIRFIGAGSVTVEPGITATINNPIQGVALSGYTVDTDVEINGGGTLRMGGGNGSLAFTIAAGTTVEVTGGSYSGWNLNTVNGTLRTLANNVLPSQSGYRDTGAGVGIIDLAGFNQSVTSLGGGLTVTNGNSPNHVRLGLTMISNTQTLTGSISDGTGGGKVSVFTTGSVGQGIGFQSTINFNTQTFAGANTFTGSFTHGRGTVVLDFSGATSPAKNIFYNGGFGTAPSGDDGKLIFNRPVGTVGVPDSAMGSIATLQLTGKADTANTQQFRGLKLDTNGAGQIYINPNATGSLALDLGSTLERESGGFVNFSTTNATTALSANARILSTAGAANSLLTSADGVAFATISGQDWAGKNAANDEIVAVSYTPSAATGFATGANITLPTAGGASNDVRLGANTSIASLRYGNSGSRSGVMLGGNTLTTGGILVSSVTNSTGSFMSGGTVTSPGSDVVLAHFAGSSNRWFQMDAVIADNAAGATGFTKAGTGITVLSADNTFTGELTSHQGGLIVLGKNDGASAVNINGAQTNLMGGRLPTTATTGSFLQIGNSGAAGTIGSGPINIGGNAILAIKTSDDITIENTISGLGGLTLSGTGTTTLVSAPTAKYNYVGDTTLDGGTLKLDYTASNTGIIGDNSRLVLGGGTIEYATAADTTHNDTVRGFALISGATTITKTGTGAGRLRLNGVSDIQNAGSTVNFTADGVADTDIAVTAGILGDRARFTVGTGTTYNWATQSGSQDSPVGAFSGYTDAATTTSGTNSNNSRLVNSNLALTGNLTTNTLKVESTTTAVARTIDIGAANTLTLTAGGLLVTGSESVTINNGTLKSNTASNSDLIIHQHNTGGLTIASVIANGNGTSTLTKSGNGTLTLTGANTYTGQTFLNGGTTVISANAALGAPLNGATLNLNNATLRVTDDVILSNGTIGTNNRSVVLNGVGGTLEVDAAKTLTVAGSISGPGGLTKTGAGTLEIRSNSSTGPTRVQAGTLRYGAAVNNVYSALTVAAGATVDVFGFGNMVGSLDGAGTITNTGTAAATLTVGGLPTDTTFSGQLTQLGTVALHFDKAGPGVLTLTNGTNNTTGTFTISGGTLALSGAGVFTTQTGTSAGAVTVSSAAATLDVSGITANSISAGSIASVAGSRINLGSKVLIAGSNNGSTTLAGVISGNGGGLIKTATAVGNGTLTITGENTYTGETVVDQGTLRVRDSVLVNTPGPLGNSDTTILVGSPTSAPGGQHSAHINLHVQPVGDEEHLTFARSLDFSQALRNATNNDRSRFRFESNGNGTADMQKLTLSGDVKLGVRNTEFYVDKAGQTLEFTGNITGGSGATVFLTGLASNAANGDGASGGTFRFSDMDRTFNSSVSLTLGRAIIEGSVPASGPSPIGAGSISLSDGNGGNTLSTGAAAANRGIFLETPGATFARSLAPGGGSNVTLPASDLERYGSGLVRLMNTHQFGGTNTSGTVTFSSPITPSSVNVSVTGTAGGLGGTNPVKTVHNLALIAQTGGTVVFDGIISGSTAPVLGATDAPGASGTGNLARVTINQVRNHPNIDENRDGIADDTADQLVGTATGGTVILNGFNTYGGTTEVLGGTLLVNGSIEGDSVTVHSGATLGGNGFIVAGAPDSKLLVHGGIAPRAALNSIGVLTTEKPVIFSSGASLTMEINGIFPGLDYDQLAVASQAGITLAGNNQINLTLGFVPQMSTVFTLIANYSEDPIAGTFANLPDDGVVFLSFGGNQYAFQANYQGGTGNDLTLTTIPEPSAATALLAGFGALLGVRRRRR